MCLIEQYSGDGRRQTLQDIGISSDTHAGLWLDTQLPGKQESRNLILQASRVNAPSGYQRAVAQREEVLRGLDGGISGGVTLVWEAETDGRLVIGLGTESVRETNLALNHTWGVPILPGSALKGVASMAAQLHGGATWKQLEQDDTSGGEDHQILFGDTSSAGYVTFHDAWWLPEQDSMPLDLDIMTVHHQGYYGGREDAPPADWDSPNPVPFMTSSGKFLVALSGPRPWVQRAAEWLEIALKRHGIGGKTRAGYGRMKLTPRLTEKERDLDIKERVLMSLAKNHHGKSTARQHLDWLYDALQEDLLDASVIRTAGATLHAADHVFWTQWGGAEDEDTRQKMLAVGLLLEVQPEMEKADLPVVDENALEAALDALDGLSQLNKIGKKVLSKYWVKLSETERKVLAQRIKSMCEERGEQEILDKLADLRGYI